MNRRAALLTLLSIPLAAPLASQAQNLGSMVGALKDPLTNMLMSKLGVTENQAKGGIGSYLTLAKEKLAKGDFDKLSALLPGASKYMDTAKKLGAVSGPIGNLAGLNSSLGKLGMKPEAVTAFAPTVTDYIGKVGGDGVSSMLSGILK
jgi:Protein of unknown function VcgC/VcgE (DUF2780)